MDQIGGMIKAAVRREVAGAQSSVHADDMAEFLEQEFPNYLFDVISTKELEYRGSGNVLLSVKIINGSSKLQFVVFTPERKQIKSSPRLFICDNCPVN